MWWSLVIKLFFLSCSLISKFVSCNAQSNRSQLESECEIVLRNWMINRNLNDFNSIATICRQLILPDQVVSSLKKPDGLNLTKLFLQKPFIHRTSDHVRFPRQVEQINQSDGDDDVKLEHARFKRDFHRSLHAQCQKMHRMIHKGGGGGQQIKRLYQLACLHNCVHSELWQMLNYNRKKGNKQMIKMIKQVLNYIQPVNDNLEEEEEPEEFEEVKEDEEEEEDDNEDDNGEDDQTNYSGTQRHVNVQKTDRKHKNRHDNDEEEEEEEENFDEDDVDDDDQTDSVYDKIFRELDLPIKILSKT